MNENKTESKVGSHTAGDHNTRIYKTKNLDVNV